MADINAPQGGVLVTVRQDAQGINAFQGQVLVSYNIPSQGLNVTYGGVNVVLQQATKVRAAQAQVLAAVRGNISNPRLRAWTFDLDGHEFYVLRLGNDKTLVFDLTTGTWSWWSSGAFDHWRALIGTNWIENGTVAYDHGSNVVVGDDSTGILWALNPLQGYDDPVAAGDREDGVQRSFPRVATGQMITRGRVTVPCYQAYLTASNGRPAVTDSTVTLSYSDDGGNTFVSASEPMVVESGNYYQEFAWRSMGLIRSPGRLFRVSDDGAFAKINELTVYDGSD